MPHSPTTRPTRRLCLCLLASVGALWWQGAGAQLARSFPGDALRGRLVLGQAPQASLNGRAARLAPGARIRDADNLYVQPATLIGRQLQVNYTVDINGDLGQIWVLRPEELAVEPWPRTVEQRDAWQFDPTLQRWTRP